MVDQAPKKKRKVTSKAGEDVSKQPIEALEAYKELHASWPPDMPLMLSAVGISEKRRQELWELLTQQASEHVDRYAWAVPDERALRILDNFSPIVEIGAGAGYWAHCMRNRGIECSAYDLFPALTLDGTPRQPWSAVEEGGPDQLQTEDNQGKTLLLCYPDDFENQGKSLAAECLQMLQSDFVVHCGELIGDTSSLDHAPWGRTTGASAQQHLFSLFRCVIKVPLPSWPHCNDYLTVWRRMDTCHVQMSVHDAERKESNRQHDATDLGASEGEQVKQKLTKSSVAEKGATQTNGTETNNDDGSDEDAEQRDGPDSSNEDDAEREHSDEEGDAMEFICDAEQMSLGSEGWALPCFKHLL